MSSSNINQTNLDLQMKTNQPRFANIPNILQGKSLCAVIKKWREQQKQSPPPLGATTAAPGEEGSSRSNNNNSSSRESIDWEAISQDLNSMEGGGEGGGGAASPSSFLSPTACEILWKYLAYGLIVTEDDLALLPDTPLLRAPVSVPTDRHPTANNIVAKTPKPVQRKRASKSLPSAGSGKKKNMIKKGGSSSRFPASGPMPVASTTSMHSTFKSFSSGKRPPSAVEGQVTQVKRRPGTKYVACEHCQKDISHSNVAAHVRKAHPELAKKKIERIKKSHPFSSSASAPHAATTPARTSTANICTSSAVGTSIHLPNSNNVSSTTSRVPLGTSGPRSTCPHCKISFSARHLSQHIKKQHPVHAAMESLIRTVVGVNSKPLPPPPRAIKAKTASSKRPVPSSSTNTNTKGAKEEEGEGPLRARQRRESLSSACAHCGVTIAKKNMAMHMRKLHPGVLLGEGDRETQTQLEDRGGNSKESATGTIAHKDAQPLSLSLGSVKENIGKLLTVKSDIEIPPENILCADAHVSNVHPELAVREAGRPWTGRPPVSCPTTQCSYCRKIITKKSIRAHVRNLHPEAAVGDVLAAATASTGTGAGNNEKEQAPRTAKNMKQQQQQQNFAVARKPVKKTAGGTGKTSASMTTTATTAVPLPITTKVTSIHGRMETVACQYCQLQVPKTEMLNHVKSAHSRTRTAQCKYCPKLIQYRNMNTHVRKYHVVESVLEGMVGQVVGSTDPPPAVVVEVDCSLPVSRLLALSNIVWHSSSTSSTSSSSSSTPAVAASAGPSVSSSSSRLQKEKSSGSGSGSAAGVGGKNAKKRKAAPHHPSSSSSMKETKKIKPGGKKDTNKSKNNAPGRNNNTSHNYNNSSSSSGDGDSGGADFSDLDLLATFASTLLPMSVISI